MPAGSLLTLLDDIATVLDDVAVMTKVAAKKAAGVLGDDLALNAQQLTGVTAERELPVVWAVAKGSAFNKLIIVPSALAISAFIPWAITPLLVLGGLYLCYEGFEKVIHKLFFSHDKHDDAHSPAPAVSPVASAEAPAATPVSVPAATPVSARAELASLMSESVNTASTPPDEPVVVEADQIRGAIRTDIILSAEIIVITLGVVADKPFQTQVAVLCAIAAAMTIGVYGLVAGIVKLDDAGLALTRRRSAIAQRLGHAIVWTAPHLLRLLGIVGTIAMFLVGGGILTHAIPAVHHWVEHLAHETGGLATLVQMGLEGAIGVVAGGIVLGVVTLFQRLRGSPAPAPAH